MAAATLMVLIASLGDGTSTTLAGMGYITGFPVIAGGRWRWRRGSSR